jgi:hypothetical protein
MTIEEVRRILGREADGKTDEQLERLRDGLVVLANETYDSLTRTAAVSEDDIKAAAVSLPGFPATSEAQLRRDAADRIRWIAHAHEHGIEGEE